MASLHQFLNVVLKAIHQTTVEFVFPVVLENYVCSILNQRLLKHVDLNNILYKSQIGFLANNRAADHVLTLRTLIDKYVHCHKEKI